MSRAAAHIGRALATLWLAVTAAFLLTRVSGDPAVRIAGELATDNILDGIRHQLGTDRPLIVQYFDYLWHLIRFDLGKSLTYHTDNLELIGSRLPASLALAVGAMAVAIVVGVPLGVISAARVGSLIDRVVSVISLIGQSVPLFWVGLMAIMFLAVRWGMLPAGGNESLTAYILPTLTLATIPLAQITRLTRSSMGEALSGGFISAGLARGLSRTRMIWNHALRHTALPVLTVIALQAGMLLSGSVTVEVVYSWPGMGRLIASAVELRDFTLVQGLVVVAALVFVVANLAVDLLYPVIDPRLRRSRS